MAPTDGTAESEARQALRSRIARQRRRLDRRISRIADSVLLLASWQRFVERHPGRSLLTAAGIGAFLSRLLTRDQSLPHLGRRLFDRSDWLQIWLDFLAIFRGQSTSEDEGSDRG